MSEEIYGKVDSDVDVFKKILRKVPGFKGYIERENRRDSDKILREMVSDRLLEQHQRLSSIQREFISQGEIFYVDDLESAAIKIQTLADRMRRATRGYAGIFDPVKINEDELALLYQFDSQLLDSVDEISRSIDNIELSIGTDGLPASIRNLVNVSQSLINTYNKREEVILAAEE